MLDFTKLMGQLDRFGQVLAQEAVASRQRLDRLEQLFQEALKDPQHWTHQHQTWRDRLGFMAAEPLEPLDTALTVFEPHTFPEIHTVLSTDGSQIAPSHHEVAFCYLLNIGRVALHYGNKRYPRLDSVPSVFYEAQDLYGARQWGIGTEEWMGYRRTVAEAEGLADLVAETLMDSSTAPPSPTVAIVDGSLIYWFLDTLPAPARSQILPPILAAWQRIHALGVPLLSYISASRSTDSLNFFRLLRCPHPVPDCDRYCAGQTDRAPCQVFAPLKDVTFWQTRLQPGQRGPLWRSHARILHHYQAEQPDSSICFCHLHVGSEIARVEFPASLIKDQTRLHQALAIVLAQVQKGYGYPVALAEAHHQAVVKGGDRRRFFALLEQSLQDSGLQKVSPSSKETRKRESIV